MKRLAVALSVLLASSGAALLPSAEAASGVDYYYAVAGAQITSPAAGFQATFTVEKPRQISHRLRNHSLGQIGVGQHTDRSQLEAGWIVEKGRPRLFSYWRPATGAATCYNTCGFHKKGPGKKPGTPLKQGSTITIGYEHLGSKWWLLVDGKKSGFYPDKLWKGRTFTGTDTSQVWGEVTAKRGTAPCVDMGNGTDPLAGPAAQITDVTWLGGPPVQLFVSTETDAGLYDVVLTGPNSMSYGGPGAC